MNNNNRKDTNMSTPKTISIDGTDYVRASDVNPNTDAATQIVVADRGWVFVGKSVHTEVGVKLTNAKVVRKWGTTKGLGEIALNGPTKNTVLDDAGTVTVPHGSVVALFDTNPEKWA